MHITNKEVLKGMNISTEFSIGQELYFVQVDDNFENIKVPKCTVEEIQIINSERHRYHVKAEDGRYYGVCEKSLFRSPVEALDVFKTKLYSLNLNAVRLYKKICNKGEKKNEN